MRQRGKILWSQTGHRLQYGACALHVGYLGLKRTLRTCNIYFFSTATMLTRKRLKVRLYVQCVYCLCLIFKFPIQLYIITTLVTPRGTLDESRNVATCRCTLLHFTSLESRSFPQTTHQALFQLLRRFATPEPLCRSS